MACRETGPNKISSIQLLRYNAITPLCSHKNIWLPRLAAFSFPQVNIIVNEPFGVTLSCMVISPQHVSTYGGLWLADASFSCPLIGWCLNILASAWLISMTIIVLTVDKSSVKSLSTVLNSILCESPPQGTVGPRRGGSNPRPRPIWGDLKLGESTHIFWFLIG